MQVASSPHRSEGKIVIFGALYHFMHLQIFDLVNPKLAIIHVYLQEERDRKAK